MCRAHHRTLSAALGCWFLGVQEQQRERNAQEHRRNVMAVMLQRMRSQALLASLQRWAAVAAERARKHARMRRTLAWWLRSSLAKAWGCWTESIDAAAATRATQAWQRRGLARVSARVQRRGCSWALGTWVIHARMVRRRSGASARVQQLRHHRLMSRVYQSWSAETEEACLARLYHELNPSGEDFATCQDFWATPRPRTSPAAPTQAAPGGGVGIWLGARHGSGIIFVKGLVAGSPAEQSHKIEIGDVLLRVDSHPFFPMATTRRGVAGGGAASLEDANTRIRGKAGTGVELEFLRESAGHTRKAGGAGGGESVTHAVTLTRVANALPPSPQGTPGSASRVQTAQGLCEPRYADLKTPRSRSLLLQLSSPPSQAQKECKEVICKQDGVPDQEDEDGDLRRLARMLQVKTRMLNEMARAAGQLQAERARERERLQEEREKERELLAAEVRRKEDQLDDLRAMFNALQDRLQQIEREKVAMV